jgi:hypothetical protein
MSVVTDPRAERRQQAIALALIALLFAVGGFIMWYRGTYNVFPGQSADSRVHWCNRDYDSDGVPPQSLRQIEAGATSPVQVVENYPPLALHRDQLLAEIYPGPHTYSCAVAVYLRTGQDRYAGYELSGGP